MSQWATCIAYLTVSQQATSANQEESQTKTLFYLIYTVKQLENKTKLLDVLLNITFLVLKIKKTCCLSGLTSWDWRSAGVSGRPQAGQVAAAGGEDVCCPWGVVPAEPESPEEEDRRSTQQHHGCLQGCRWDAINGWKYQTAIYEVFYRFTFISES